MSRTVRLDRSSRSIVLVCRRCAWREVVTRVTGSAASTAAAAHELEHAERDKAADRS